MRSFWWCVHTQNTVFRNFLLKPCSTTFNLLVPVRSMWLMISVLDLEAKMWQCLGDFFVHLGRIDWIPLKPKLFNLDHNLLHLRRKRQVSYKIKRTAQKLVKYGFYRQITLKISLKHSYLSLRFCQSGVFSNAYSS